MEKSIHSTMQERSGMVRRSGIDRRITSRQIPLYMESLEKEDIRKGFFEQREGRRRTGERRDVSLNR